MYAIYSSSYICSSLEERLKYDVAIIGGGIIGTAIAREIKIKSKNVKIILIEKESHFGKHQSSHNSGVIHSGTFVLIFYYLRFYQILNNIYFIGIYYKPGSLKAKFCIKGGDLLYSYCQTNNVPFKIGGKLIVASECDKIDTLKKLYERGITNGVKDLKLLSSLEEIIKIEPEAKGMGALWCANTGNVDFQTVTKKFGRDFRNSGGDILFNNEVSEIKFTKITNL